MSRIFDGIAGILTGVFGDTVTATPVGGSAGDIQGIFRDSDVPVLNDAGAETISPFPTIVMHRDDAAALIPGGLVEPGNGSTYKCLAKMDGGSPDPRGLVTVQLEKVA